MGKEQLKLGDDTEKDIAKFFRGLGYWVFIIPKKIGGQPFDIIASKNNVSWFVDAKHLEENKASFPFSRIEPNQETSMNYARTFANITNVGFVIKWERDNSRLFFLNYEQFINFKKNGVKSVKISDLQDLERMIKEYEYNYFK